MASSFMCSASRTRITPTSFGSRVSARCQSANKIRHPHFLPCSKHAQLLSFLDNKALRRHCFDERFEGTAKKHEVEAVEFMEKIKVVGENEEEVETENDGLASALTEESTGIVEQMKGIIQFAGPAVGIWACGPLMSLIDTAVVGQVSSMELAALGPATVLCDVTGYMFMFLSIATSNMVATSLAEKDEDKMQSQFSTLLFIALFCGFTLLILTKAFGMHLLKAFVGSKNAQIIPAANSYIQMHGLTLPLFLSVMVTPATSSMEGSLLAGRDLKYLSCVMSYCFFFCSIFLLIATKKDLGLQACWWCLVCFNWSRFLAVYLRVNSPNSPISAATL